MGTNLFSRFKDFWLGESGLSAFLGLLFVAMFLAPIVDSPAFRLVTSLIFSLLLIIGVASMSRRREVRISVSLVALAAIALRWLTHIVPSRTIVCWSIFASLVFMVILTVVILIKVFTDKSQVTPHRIMGAIAAYLLFGLTWAILYNLLDQLIPHAFNLPAAAEVYDPERQGILAYYSFVTLTTVGYGDITPTHDISRLFAITEALIGQLYPATLLARLVSLEVMHRGNVEVSAKSTAAKQNDP